MKSPDIAIHTIVAGSLLLAVLTLAIGYGSENIGYLLLLLGALNVCILAAILFVLERMIGKIK